MVRGSNGPHPQFRMRSEEYQGPKSDCQNEYDGYEDDAAIGSQLQPSLRLSHSDEAQVGFLHAVETFGVRDQVGGRQEVGASSSNQSRIQSCPRMMTHWATTQAQFYIHVLQSLSMLQKYSFKIRIRNNSDGRKHTSNCR